MDLSSSRLSSTGSGINLTIMLYTAIRRAQAPDTIGSIFCTFGSYGRSPIRARRRMDGTPPNQADLLALRAGVGLALAAAGRSSALVCDGRRGRDAARRAYLGAARGHLLRLYAGGAAL